MAILSSLHTHNTFCDGKSSIKEMIESALSLNFTSIGISSHCYTGYSFDTCGIKKERIEEYYNTVLRYKDEYKNRINVYLGLELESRIEGEERPILDPRLDYAIGSVHLFRTPNGIFSIDNTPQEWKSALSKYNNNYLSLIETYLDELYTFSRSSPFDIVGHFDLYTKFNEKENLFDEEDDKYKKLALYYLEKIAKENKIFEVNTGAMSRGWKTKPYPAPFLLERLKKLNAPIIVTSDSHNKDTLSYGYRETEKMLKDLGFTTQMALSDKGWINIPL